MFRKKKQPPPPPVHKSQAPARKAAVKPPVPVKLSLTEYLQQAQGALRRLRGISPGDLQAFPLLNEIQRLVQHIKDASAALHPVEREAWGFQVADLEEEFRELADAVVAKADAAPKPEPRPLPPGSWSAPNSARGPGPGPAAGNGRVQQAVAFFSRQEGAASADQAAPALFQRRSAAQQQQQQPATPERASQAQASPHSQAYGPMSPSHSQSPTGQSYIYLTEEERDQLAQRQRTLLQKHQSFLEQQRVAQLQQLQSSRSSGNLAASASGGMRAPQLSLPALQVRTDVSSQQPQQQQWQLQQWQQQAQQQWHPQAAEQDSWQPQQQLLLQQQQQQQAQWQQQQQAQWQHQQQLAAQQQYQQQQLLLARQREEQLAQQQMQQLHRGQQQGAPFPEHGSARDTHTYSADVSQAASAAITPSWSTSALPMLQAQQGAQPQQGSATEMGEDDLFSGLDVVAADESHAMNEAQRGRGPAAAAEQNAEASAGPAGQVGAAMAEPERQGPLAATSAPQPSHSFRPAGHSTPHRMYAGSQSEQRAGLSAGASSPLDSSKAALGGNERAAGLSAAPLDVPGVAHGEYSQQQQQAAGWGSQAWRAPSELVEGQQQPWQSAQQAQAPHQALQQQVPSVHGHLEQPMQLQVQQAMQRAPIEAQAQQPAQYVLAGPSETPGAHGQAGAAAAGTSPVAGGESSMPFSPSHYVRTVSGRQEYGNAQEAGMQGWQQPPAAAPAGTVGQQVSSLVHPTEPNAFAAATAAGSRHQQELPSDAAGHGASARASAADGYGPAVASMSPYKHSSQHENQQPELGGASFQGRVAQQQLPLPPAPPPLVGDDSSFSSAQQRAASPQATAQEHVPLQGQHGQLLQHMHAAQAPSAVPRSAQHLAQVPHEPVQRGLHPRAPAEQHASGSTGTQLLSSHPLTPAPAGTWLPSTPQHMGLTPQASESALGYSAPRQTALSASASGYFASPAGGSATTPHAGRAASGASAGSDMPQNGAAGSLTALDTARALIARVSSLAHAGPPPHTSLPSAAGVAGHHPPAKDARAAAVAVMHSPFTDAAAPAAVAAPLPQAATPIAVAAPPATHAAPQAASRVGSVSSAAARSRSRTLFSAGGAGASSDGGHAVDLAAALPSVASLPCVAELEEFLNNATGSVDACRGAAEERARVMVSELGGALAAAQKVEAAVVQQRRSVKAALSGLSASVGQLEAQQAAAVEAEDFDTAALLDEQLTQQSHRRAQLEEQEREFVAALQKAAALRLEVLGRQAEAWRVAGAYLARLQAGQQQMATALAAQAEREAQAAATLHRTAQEALAQRRALLDERNRELSEAAELLAAKVAEATAPAEAERERRTRVRDALQAEVESLRAMLTAKEAALAQAEAAVSDAMEAVRQQAAAYDRDTACLDEARGLLAAEAAQVAGQEQALQESERQAAASCAAVKEHQEQLRLQANALGEAAEAMRAEAEALAARVTADSRAQEQRERLLREDEAAREELKSLERCIADLSSDLSRLAEQRGRLAAERAAAQDSLASLQRAMPELEAAKRAAAASKDFREAARLSGELRALLLQVDLAAAQLARVSGSLAELAATESSKVSELEELRAMVHEAQRAAAEAHHRYLVFCLGLSRSSLEAALGSEMYEEAGALHAEVAAEEAELLVLERTWGFVRPAQQQQQPSPQPGSRRLTAQGALSAGGASPAQQQARRLSLGATSTHSSVSSTSRTRSSALQGLQQNQSPSPLQAWRQSSYSQAAAPSYSHGSNAGPHSGSETEADSPVSPEGYVPPAAYPVVAAAGQCLATRAASSSLSQLGQGDGYSRASVDFGRSAVHPGVSPANHRAPVADAYSVMSAASTSAPMHGLAVASAAAALHAVMQGSGGGARPSSEHHSATATQGAPEGMLAAAPLPPAPYLSGLAAAGEHSAASVSGFQNGRPVSPVLASASMAAHVNSDDSAGAVGDGSSMSLATAVAAAVAKASSTDPQPSSSLREERSATSAALVAAAVRDSSAPDGRLHIAAAALQDNPVFHGLDVQGDSGLPEGGRWDGDVGGEGQVARPPLGVDERGRPWEQEPGVGTGADGPTAAVGEVDTLGEALVAVTAAMGGNVLPRDNPLYEHAGEEAGQLCR